MSEQSGRKAFIESLKDKLDQLNEEIDRLEAKAKDASGKAEKKYEEQLADVRQKRAEMKNKLSELRAAGEAEFARIKLEAEHAWKAFQNSFNYFKSHFK